MIVTQWREEHREIVTDMIRQFLAIGVERGGNLADTRRNAEALWELGLAAAKVGDPCLVALAENEVPIAYIQWQGVPNCLDAVLKEMQTFGSFTHFGYRSTGISTALRDRALEIAKERGYQLVTGVVQAKNGKGQRYFHEKGATVAAIAYEYRL